MNKIAGFMLIYGMTVSVSFASNEVTELVNESKAVVQVFFTELKSELGKSLKADGPVSAIKVCTQAAPQIASRLSAEHGMKVARTSLKTRNSANAADEWERKVLKLFEKRHSNGESLADMTHYEVVENSEGKSFRFMRAIGMPPLSKMPCLKCHGEVIDDKVVDEISKYYPDDMARGYKAGEIRGAFTLSKSLD